MKQFSFSLPEIKTENLGYFRYGQFDDDYLVTNDVGEWAFLNKMEFNSFLAGERDLTD